MQVEWDTPAYEKISDPRLRRAEAVIDRLELSGTERVLDIGCGTGRLTEQLLRRLPGGRVIALDPSARMVHEASRRLAGERDRTELIVADAAEPLPVEPPVDAVLSTATFHWVLDHDRLFANIAAVLRPGGRLVAQCGGAGNLSKVIGIVRDLGGAVDEVNFATPEATVGRLTRAGFCDCMAWLQPEPTPFDGPEELGCFLEQIVLRTYLPRLPGSQRSGFLLRVMEQLGDHSLDFVRLNIDARRADGDAAEGGGCRW